MASFLPLRSVASTSRSCLRRTVPARTYAVKAGGSSSPSSSNSPGSASAAPKSSCPENTAMPGIKWLKAQEEVIAMPDDAYPPWLWNLLKPKKFTKAERGPGSVEEHAKKNRENRQKIRDANFMQTQ